MKHIEPIKNLPYNSEYSTGTYWTDNLPPSMSELVVKINEIVEVLNSLTEKKLPVECELRKKGIWCDCEPEKTAESWEKTKVSKIVDEFISIVSDWLPVDRRRKVADLANEFLFEAIMSSLTSHTEQKKKELIYKIKKIKKPTYFVNDPSLIDPYEEATDDDRVFNEALKEVLHLIKEL